MGRIRLLALCCLLMVGVVSVMPAQGQGPTGFNWPAPLNPGQMPTNNPLLPPIPAMPGLPLPEPLQPGTLFFNVQSFGAEYQILNVTFDTRLFAYNISRREGILPISPNGQYGITKQAESERFSTCGILDMLTGQTVDTFETDSTCTGVAWSPDSTRVLLTTLDAEGRSVLGIRQNGQTTTFRPMPAGEVDMGGIQMTDNWLYIAPTWVSNDVITFDIGYQGILAQQLFTRVGALDAAYSSNDLTLEQTLRRFVTWRPAQALESFNRGVWLTDVATGDSFALAPAGYTALYAATSPDDSAVVYWAAVEGQLGPAHPLRLVMYIPATDQQVVLLQFDGPEGEVLTTRPGLIVWNPEGIYFHISQQEGTPSPLLTGAYRIQPDGSNLEFITSELLWSSLPSK